MPNVYKADEGQGTLSRKKLKKITQLKGVTYKQLQVLAKDRMEWKKICTSSINKLD